jgi:hypothetical protein
MEKAKVNKNNTLIFPVEITDAHDNGIRNGPETLKKFRGHI